MNKRQIQFVTIHKLSVTLEPFTDHQYYATIWKSVRFIGSTVKKLVPSTHATGFNSVHTTFVHLNPALMLFGLNKYDRKRF